jgi:hypothetical protein
MYVEGSPSNLPNPFMVRDQSGRLPLHIACMMHGTVGMDASQWITDSTHQRLEAMKTRDASILDAVRKTDPSATVKNVLAQGHYAWFYACTTLIDEKG